MIYVFFMRSKRGWSNRLIRILGRSELTHCAIGDRTTTIDFKFDGPRFWVTNQFVDKYPNLVVMVRVEATGPMLPRLGTIPIWPTVWRWLGFPVEAHDCVQQTARILREAGVNLPRVTTPDDLLAALQVCGYYLRVLTLEPFQCRSKRRPASAISR